MIPIIRIEMKKKNEGEKAQKSNTNLSSARGPKAYK
jgi:hypothetical protein